MPRSIFCQLYSADPERLGLCLHIYVGAEDGLHCGGSPVAQTSYNMEALSVFCYAISIINECALGALVCSRNHLSVVYSLAILGLSLKVVACVCCSAV